MNWSSKLTLSPYLVCNQDAKDGAFILVNEENATAQEKKENLLFIFFQILSIFSDFIFILYNLKVTFHS